jgi:hypothetical protein
MLFGEQFALDKLIGVPKNETQSNVNDALFRYFALSSLSDFAKSRSSEADLRKKKMELDIEMQKRALGIPRDTESFNEELNTPVNHLIAALGIKFEDRLDSPNVIQKSIRAAHPLRDLFDVNRPIRAGLPGAGGGLRRLLGLR